MKSDEIIKEIKNGKLFICSSYERRLKIDSKCINKWELAGYNDLISDDGDGLRIRRGKSSIFIFSNQWRLI